MKSLVIANPKGGVGKSLCAILAFDYFTSQSRRKKVAGVDSDANGTFRFFLDLCAAAGRDVKAPKQPDLRIVDTAGQTSAVNAFLEEADLVLVPSKLATADLKRLSDWLLGELAAPLRGKLAFVPNGLPPVGLTREQQRGQEQLLSAVSRLGLTPDRLLTGLCDRPAVFGTLYNGSESSFFDETPEHNSSAARAQAEARAVFGRVSEFLFPETP